MTVPYFGITFARSDDEPRPTVPSDMSVVGLIGTAPLADVEKFPLNKAVYMASTDAAMLTALGATGTLPDALAGINAQLADFQVSARVVMVRVADDDDSNGEDQTIANIVGSEGSHTGLYAFLDAGRDLAVIPRLIAAPGYTHQHDDDSQGEALANPVCAALPAVCSRLLAHAVVEGPGKSSAVTDEEVQAWRETIASDRLIPVDAWVKLLSGSNIVVKPGVGHVIGLAVATDFRNRGIPSRSWANQAVQGIVGWARPVDFSLTDGATQGQVLLGENIGIGVRGEMNVESAAGASGFVFLGTDNAGSDALWQFYSTTRMRDYIHLVLLKTLRQRLGRTNINVRAIDVVLDDVRFFLRDLAADERILRGFRVSFDPSLNSPENLRLGHFRLYFRAEETPVLTRLDIDSMRYRPALDTLLADLLASLPPEQIAAAA